MGAIFNYVLNRLTTVSGDLSIPKQEIVEITQQGSDDILSTGKYAYFVNQTDFSEVLQDVTIIDIDVNEDSKIMDSPVESGITISDHRINNPTEITVNCTLPRNNWENAYKELRYWYEQKTTNFLSIQTKAKRHSNMQLIAIPHKEASDTVTRLFFELKFREVRFVVPQYIRMPLAVVEKPQNAQNIDAGNKQAKPVKESALKKLARS